VRFSCRKFATRKSILDGMVSLLRGFAGVDRAASTGRVSPRHCCPLWLARSLPENESGGPGLLQPKKPRSQPPRAGDLSRQGGKRTVPRAVPGEAVIEHQHFIGSALPFSKKQSPGFSVGRARRLISPAPLDSCPIYRSWRCRCRPRPPRATSCIGYVTASQRRIGFVEGAPLLTKRAEIELRKARKRLPASRCVLY